MRSKATLIDIYVFYVCQYFGLLSLIDASLNMLSSYSPFYIFYVHFLILISVFIIMFMRKLSLTKKYIEFFSLKNLVWLVNDSSSIKIRSLSVLLFIVHLLLSNTLISQFSSNQADGRLQIIIEESPYWVTSILMLYRTIFFIAVIITFLAALRGLRSKTKLYLVDVIIFIILAASLYQYGRTYTFNALFLCAILFIFSSEVKIKIAKITTYFFISFATLLLFSNYVQTYRGGKNQDIDSITAILNFEATANNLKIRMPMWKFSYMIAESRDLYNKSPDYPGQLTVKISRSAVPSILLPNIEKSVGDIIISKAFGFEVTDYPSNIFSTLLADFGLLSAIVMPLVLMTIVIIFFKLCRLVLPKYPEIALFYFLMLWSYLAFIESEIVGIPLLFRDLIIFSFSFYMLNIFGKIFTKNRVNKPRKLTIQRQNNI